MSVPVRDEIAVPRPSEIHTRSLRPNAGFRAPSGPRSPAHMRRVGQRPGMCLEQRAKPDRVWGALPDDAVLEMRHAVGLAEPGLFQLDSLREPVEQPAAPAEQ